MFYRLIEKKRDAWLATSSCPVNDVIGYIETRGMMRDAQIEAIKTYLYLKIGCRNQPLWALFYNGVVTSPDNISLTAVERIVLENNVLALALMEYAMLETKPKKPLAPELVNIIKSAPETIDYEKVFKRLFYNVSYPDYLFSLPMGAGKTFLMAAFIYLDLYFAQQEPDNPIFAHNFMIMAPSGLKSSIIPSLKNIQRFDPSWILPEPAASQIKKLVKFELLDEQKSAKKSNRTKNPNSQKVNMHLAQEGNGLMGLVAITNAEKVILNRYGDDVNPTLLSKEELAKCTVANELRNIIGKIPQLAVFIDEVHHAADSEIKLRQVVNGWAAESNFNCMLGFSGTPYLETAESVAVTDTFTIKSSDLANVVYHYPLIDGIGNFLKYPTIRYADDASESIIRQGLTDFFDKFRNTVYPGGLCAKLAIYCGKIETLEEVVYPIVAEVVEQYQLNPSEVVLKYHDGNKQYHAPEGAEAAFAALDKSISKIRVVLLVQIGKEGWDCRSLTGVILSQKGDCPTNMVLQTSCRCLRQVQRDAHEEAIIWLNKFNADTLNKQLSKTQNTSVAEINGKQPLKTVALNRYSRMDRLQVPPIDFYQLRVVYNTLIIEEADDPRPRLENGSLAKQSNVLIHEQDMQGKVTKISEAQEHSGMPITYRDWLYTIIKESFGSLKMADLRPYDDVLSRIFHTVTKVIDSQRLTNEQYDQQRVRSLIRQAFAPRRDFETHEEVISTQASLLQIERLTSPITTYEGDTHYYPTQDKVEDILREDNAPAITPEIQKAIELFKAQNMPIPEIEKYPERRQTYHYLPYRFDSTLEQDYLVKALACIKDKPLEIYFNGDDNLTEFKIDCYKQHGKHWVYIGKYVPDFLIISRDAQGGIHKVIIVETKGEGFAAKFADRRKFMETQFIQQNNEKFGYRRFDFLYIEDTMKPTERDRMTIDKIKEFFNNNEEGGNV